MTCAYCGERPGTYEQKAGKWCCESHYTKCPAVRNRNAQSVAKAHQDGRCVVPFGERRGWSKGQTLVPYEQAAKNTRRKYLILERGHRCEGCGNTEWRGQPIMLEIHNHALPKTEAQLLCPNCHAQTDNWKRKRKPQENR